MAVGGILLHRGGNGCVDAQFFLGFKRLSIQPAGDHFTLGLFAQNGEDGIVDLALHGGRGGCRRQGWGIGQGGDDGAVCCHGGGGSGGRWFGRIKECGLGGLFGLHLGRELEPCMAAVGTLHIAPGNRDCGIVNFVLRITIRANQPHQSGPSTLNRGIFKHVPEML